MNKRTKGDAVRGDEVLGRTLSQPDNGPSPAEPSAGPPNRKVLRTLALVVLLGIAGVVAWAKWATVSSIFHGGNGSDRIIGLSGRIEGDDSAVASKTSGRILEVRVREGDSVNAGQILAVLDDQQVRAREEQARGAVEGAEARAKAAKAQIDVLEEQLGQSQLQTEQATVDAEGRVSQAEADVAAAESDLARQEASFQLAAFDKDAYTRLAQTGAVSERQGEEAVAHADQQAAGEAARSYLDSQPDRPIAAYGLRIAPRATSTRETTYFPDDRVKQLVGVKLQRKDAIGFAKPGMPAEGEVLVEGDSWPAKRPAK